MHTSFALRSRTVGWRFDGRQHDAAEFYSALALSGGLQPVPWQARVDGNADRVEHGYTPLLLPVDQSSSLQSPGCLGGQRSSVRLIGGAEADG